MTIAPYREDTSAVGLPGNLSPVGLALPKGLSFQEWEHVGDTLKTIRDSALRWWWGDWLNYGEHNYGEKYSQPLAASDYGYGGLRNAAWVCGRIELSRRRDNLSFSHHQEVAPLTPDEQDTWLEDAASNRWSVHTLREMIAQTKQPKTVERAVDEDTGEVFGGGDWSPLADVPTPLFVPDPPAPTPLYSAAAASLSADGSYRDNVILEQYHATTQRLLSACSAGKDMIRHISPDTVARLLSEDDAKSYPYIAELLEWFRQVHDARGAIVTLRRVK